jgi:hypothetical protein
MNQGHNFHQQENRSRQPAPIGPRPRNNPSRQKHDEEKNKELVKDNQDVEKQS